MANLIRARPLRIEGGASLDLYDGHGRIFRGRLVIYIVDLGN